jgi:hypothetical protein
MGIVDFLKRPECSDPGVGTLASQGVYWRGRIVISRT